MNHEDYLPFDDPPVPPPPYGTPASEAALPDQGPLDLTAADADRAEVEPDPPKPPPEATMPRPQTDAAPPPADDTDEGPSEDDEQSLAFGLSTIPPHLMLGAMDPPAPAAHVGQAIDEERLAAQRRAARHDHAPTSRELVLGWCLWLLGSWAMALWIEAPGTAIPSARLLVYAALAGLMVLWPVIRLSQSGARRTSHSNFDDPENGHDDPQTALSAVHHDANAVHASANDDRADMNTDHSSANSAHDNRPSQAIEGGLTMGLILRDWFCLNLVLQSVLWPLRLTAGWSVEQTAWLVAAAAGWSLMTGLLIAWGCGSGRGSVRTAAMVLCLLLLLGEPLAIYAVATLAGDGTHPAAGWVMRVSPLEAITALADTRHPQGWRVGPWVTSLVSVAVAAAVGWVVLGVGRAIVRREHVAMD